MCTSDVPLYSTANVAKSWYSSRTLAILDKKFEMYVGYKDQI
jgi:hypothetical protein